MANTLRKLESAIRFYRNTKTTVFTVDKQRTEPLVLRLGQRGLEAGIQWFRNCSGSLTRISALFPSIVLRIWGYFRLPKKNTATGVTVFGNIKVCFQRVLYLLLNSGNQMRQLNIRDSGFPFGNRWICFVLKKKSHLHSNSRSIHREWILFEIQVRLHTKRGKTLDRIPQF